MFGKPKLTEEEQKQKALEQQQGEMQKFQQKFHIDELDSRDLETVRDISTDLAGNGFFKAGALFSNTSAADQAEMFYQSAIVRQNWIIINQLNRLNKNIEELKNK